MTPFSFPAWYARNGYAGYRGGVRDCALDLGVTREHVRLLRRGDRKPGGPLVKLCQNIVLIKTVVDDDTGEEHTLASDYVLTKPR